MSSIRTLISRAACLALAAAALGFIPSPAQAQDGPLSFNPVPPCRLWDTRGPVGPNGGPKLGANTERCFLVTGSCSVPSNARAIVLNLTATQSTDFGNIRAYPSGGAAPLASVLNFPGNGAAIPNGAIIPIGSDGRVCIRVDMPPGSVGQVHLIGDTTGYFSFP